MGFGGVLVVAGAAVLAASGPYVASRRGSWGVATLLWTLGGLVFLALSLLLAVRGLEALAMPAAPIVGSLYPVFLAAAVLAAGTRYWRHYLAFAALMLALIAAGVAAGAEGLRAAAHAGLHSVSGLILAFAPIYYGLRGVAPAPWAFLAGLGGLTISAGGVALAMASAGVELAVRLVEALLYPVLALSAVLMALGFAGSGGLGRG